MKRIAPITLFAASLLLASCTDPKKKQAEAAKGEATQKQLTSSSREYQGEYEVSTMPTMVLLEMDVKQSSGNVALSFSAAHADGRGALPEGSGKGTLDGNGVLNFTFTDSFNNEGTGTLRADGSTYYLSLKPTKVYDPKVTQLYGDLTMRKVRPGNQQPPAFSNGNDFTIPELPQG